MDKKKDILKLNKTIMILHNIDKDFPRHVFVFGYFKSFACISLILAAVSIYGNKLELSALFLLFSFMSFLIFKNVGTTFKNVTGIELNNESYCDAKEAIFKGSDIASYVENEYKIREEKRREIKEKVDSFLKNICFDSFDAKDYFNVRFALMLHKENIFGLGVKSFFFSFLFSLLYLFEVNMAIVVSEKLIIATLYFTYISFFLGIGLISFFIFTQKKYKNFLGTVNYQEELFEIYHHLTNAEIAGYSERDANKYALMKYKHITKNAKLLKV